MRTAIVSPRLLIVDDDHSARRSLRDLLDRSGFTVAVAGTAAEARRLAAETEPALVILELVLPDGDGLSLIDELRALWPGLPAIIATRYAEPRSIVEAMRRGAAEYLGKPLDPEELLSLCRTATRSRHIASPPRTEVAALPIVGESAAATTLRETITRLARARTAGALFVGEDGTGKTWLAQTLHAASAWRAPGPCLVYPCRGAHAPAIALFGTDGQTPAGGLLVGARGGTLILDDVDHLPEDVQHALLARLERGPGPLLVGLVSASEVRGPLVAWLARATIPVPPLRERHGDVMPLAARFLAATGQRLGRGFKGFSAAAEAELRRRRWPGNVRELRSAVERAAALAAGGAIQPEHLPVPGGDAAPPAWAATGPPRPLREVTEAYIDHVLACTDGNRTRAARLLGVARETLRARLIARAGR